MTTFTHQDGQYVEVAGARLYCEQQGNPQGPALVFLHGGFGDIEKIDRVYTSNEIRPICQLFDQVNDTLRGDRRISWRKPIDAEDSTTSSA